jgi:CNT family concentrative nucleoside transporter
MILPQTEEVIEIENLKMDCKGTNANVIEAISEGATTGMQLVLCIAASLVAMVGLVFAVNQILSFAGITLEQIFSYIFAPFGFFMGLNGNDIFLEGSLLGSKLVLNEFIAFETLGKIITTLEPRTAMVVAISLCGFANFSSLGICVAGISVLCPEKKTTLARLVFRAMLGGVFVSLLSAMIVSFIMLF